MRISRTVLATVVLLSAAGGVAATVTATSSQPEAAAPVLGEMVYHDISAPLTELEADPATTPRLDESRQEVEEGEAGESVGQAPERQDGRDFGEAKRRANMPQIRGMAPARDAVAQTSFGTGTAAAAPTLGTGFNGLNASGGSWGGYSYAPPDTSMDVSATQIVQTVNVGLAVYDKAGNQLVKKATNALWASFDGGLCQTTNDGDAVVLYDRLSQHWVVSQFAVSGANGSSVKYLQCVAVSVTDDATGSWSRYSFAYSFFPDYPKVSVWPNAYYTSFNGFTSSGGWYGSVVCAYDRTTMLAQLTSANPTPVKQQCYTNTNYGSLLVATVEGAKAPTDSQAYALALESTGTNGTLASWRFQPNWSLANGSSLGVSGPSSIAVSGYTEACGGGNCVPQSGTGNRLDGLGDRLMYRYVYRQLTDTTATMAVSHSVTSNGVSGARWYQFTPTTGTNAVPTLTQQGTYQPDSSYRWMPSIAIDSVGNLGMVYSVSSGSSFPSVAFTGRAPTDPDGQMGAGETIVKAGSGSQTGTLSRWGDYSAAVVDPADDCTIWVSTEYLPSSGTWNWATWIAPVVLPNCTTTSEPRVATSLSVSPTPTAVPVNATKQFTAVVYDQFGAAMSAPVSWSTTAGTISSGGLLTAPSTGTASPATVTASVTGTSPLLTSSASVSVTALSWTTAPANFSVRRTSSGSTSFTVNRTYDTNALTLAVSGLPAGVSCSFSPTSLSSGTSAGTLSCTAKSSAKVKTTTITVTARDSLGTTVSRAVSLTVT